jgi:hypothetical protein
MSESRASAICPLLAEDGLFSFQKVGAGEATALQGGRAKNVLLAVADGDTASVTGGRARGVESPLPRRAEGCRAGGVRLRCLSAASFEGAAEARSSAFRVSGRCDRGGGCRVRGSEVRRRHPARGPSTATSWRWFVPWPMARNGLWPLLSAPTAWGPLRCERARRTDSPERGQPAGPGQRGAFLWFLSCRATRKKLARRGETRQSLFEVKKSALA